MRFDVARLWIPNIKDQMSGMYASRWRYLSTLAGTAQVQATNVNDLLATCPPDKARIITGVSVAAAVAGAETLLSIVANIFEPLPSGFAAQVFSLPRESNALAATGTALQRLDAIMYPGEVVGCTVTYSAAVQVKTTTIYFWGYDVPRGNLQ